MLNTRWWAVVFVILCQAFGICFGLRISDFGFGTPAPGPPPLGGFPRLGGPSAPSLAPWGSRPPVPQPSPFRRPVPAYRPVSSPYPRRNLTVVPSIRIECTTVRLRRGYGGTPGRRWVACASRLRRNWGRWTRGQEAGRPNPRASVPVSAGSCGFQKSQGSRGRAPSPA